MKRGTLTQDQLNEILHYNPETGKLFWKKRDLSHFKNPKSCNSWNTKYSGKEAFKSTCNGYNQGRLYNVQHTAHRVIWCMVHGYWPVEVDHINGVRSDNKLANLREVSRLDNSKNLSTRSDNTSGTTGVVWDKNNNKWMVRIYDNTKVLNLGRFSDLDEAVAARRSAEEKYGYHVNHGRTSDVAA